MMPKQAEEFEHPFDTLLSGGLRFAVELIAWVGSAWVAAQYSWWLVIPTLLVVVGVPAVFSTPGDKRQVVIATPGPVRLVIELGLHAVAVASAWLIWPTWMAIGVTVIVVAALATGAPRTRWLLRGAPEGS